MLGCEYTNLLIELGLDITDSNIAEVNKGVVDSIAYANTNFSLITPYTDDMVSSYGNEIYRFKFLGKDGVPSFRTRSGIVYNLKQLVSTKHTFITENPYNYEAIEGFSNLSSSGDYNTIFGMYGMNNDKDIYDKMKMFESIRSSSGDYCKDEIITDGDKYFWIIRSNIKVKTKSR